MNVRVVQALPDAPRPATLKPVDLHDLMMQEWPASRYALDPIIPLGETTLLGGHGGVGKSMLALTLAACVACGIRWGPFRAVQLPTVYVSLEDRPEVVRYRLRAIVETYNLPPESVIAGLRIVDGSSVDATLAVEVMDMGMRRLDPTPCLDLLRMAVKDAGLIVLDNASDSYGGNENERREVRAFIRMLTNMARASDAALLLLAHIDKSAAKFGANGNAYSGSTAWHNSVRSRLALRRGDDDSIMLEHQKAQFSKPADPVMLRVMDKGVLYPLDHTAAAAVAAERDRDDDRAVLAALAAAVADGVLVPVACTGKNTSFRALQSARVLSAELADDRNRGRVAAALRRLEHVGKIASVGVRRDGKPRSVYTPADSPPMPTLEPPSIGG